MPYIKAEDRDAIDMQYRHPCNSGELNYAITKLLIHYFYSIVGGRYAQINDILGAVEGAKLEFYRRVAAPYEDKKIAENDDVYP